MLIVTRNKILSIIPSETFHIEDGIELTAKERMEAEQMQRNEQLRRRNERKEKEVGPFQHTSAHNLSSADIDPSMSSTQPVSRHGPMISTGDMLPPPSTAPIAPMGIGNMNWAPSITEPIQPAITNIHLPRIESLPYSDSAKEEKNTPVASERTSPRDPQSGANGHNAEVNEDMNDNKENNEGRKHRLAADEERVSKKAKHGAAVSLSSAERTKKTFEDLITREAARASERGL